MSDKTTGSPTVTGAEGYIVKATNDKASYIVEFAYPNANKAANTFDYSTQINNILAEDASKIICIGAQQAAHQFTLSATEVTYPEPETEAPVTEAPTDVVAVDSPAAAQTADITVITSVIALAASALVVLVAKKR